MSEFPLENIEKEIDEKIRVELQKTGKDCAKLWEKILSWYEEGGAENVKRHLLALVDEILMEEEEVREG